MGDSSKKYLLLVMLIAIILQVYYYLTLPETVATHFNAAGEADNWGSRGVSALIQTIVTLFTGGVFLLIGIILPKFPDDSFNVSNREFWLHPSRRDESIQAMQAYIYQMGTSSTLFLIVIFHFVYLYNSGSGFEPPIFTTMIIYFIVLGIQITQMFRRFNKAAMAKAQREGR
jgi:uncharacterized membrane protein